MGREIRMVPPNWEHPKKDGEDSYQPLYDEDFDIALDGWLADYKLWKDGNHPSQEDYEYWEYEGPPPDPYYYHHGWTEEPVWFQMYETVSEGTPVTPPFATKEELVNYLIENGDFWDQKRGDGGWIRANAEKFVESGWAPSGLVIVSKEGNQVKSPRDGI